ncbi:hypothetical protein [Natrinema hispanicum]|uniref:hypothetical protein n=1 Tax=Natrinema hispanicum TaxID=392421 RepID=UPI00122C9DE1|nr:hypothetical protein [Natrinema hispanicum]
MDEPDWAKVLQTVYNSKDGEIFWPLDEDGIETTLDSTDLSQEEEDKAVKYLHEIDLLEKTTNGGRDRRLTKKGFEIAHEREVQKRQETNNRNIVALTIALVGTGLIQALSSVYRLSGLERIFLAAISIVILLVVGFGIYKYTFS